MLCRHTVPLKHFCTQHRLMLHSQGERKTEYHFVNLTYHETNRNPMKNKLAQSDLPVKKKYPNYHPKIPYFEKVLFGIFLLTGTLA